MKRLLAAYADRECAMDFTQAALTAGFRGRRTLSVLFVPLAVLCFRREGASDALTIRWIETELLLWWLSALALLPPTRPLWRHRKPGFMRHAAPVLSALAPALLIARAVLAAAHGGSAKRLVVAHSTRLGGMGCAPDGSGSLSGPSSVSASHAPANSCKHRGDTGAGRAMEMKDG